jgi:RHS repeat-associated protein
VTGVGQTYLYPVRALDPDGSPVTLSLVAPPAGMTLSADGVVRWVPAAPGAYTVQVKVSDGKVHPAPAGLFAALGPGEYQHTQVYTLTVLPGAPANRGPVIVSRPPRSADADALYAYDVVAADPDDDPVRYALAPGAPDGVALDPATGALRWRPAAWQTGDQTITVRAQDRFGAEAVHTFTVLVRGFNRPPLITSSPPSDGEVNQPFAYPVRVEDPDGDAITLTWSGALPPGLQLIRGTIQGTPTAAGTYVSTLRAEDARGAVTEQPLRLVISPVLNWSPVITSDPVLDTVTGASYQYQAQATDADAGDTLTYSVATTPAVSLTVNGTGLVSWAVPSNYVAAGQTATVVVALRVTDNGSPARFAEQRYTLTVHGNRAPTLAAVGNQAVTAGNPFRLDLAGSDPDGDALAYALTGRNGTVVPATLAVDGLGRVRWADTVVGTYDFTATVKDAYGLPASRDFTLTVTADTEAPVVRLAVQDDPGTINVAERFRVVATDNVAVVERKLEFRLFGSGGAWQVIGLDSDGVGRWAFAAPAATYELRATATDAAGNPGSDTRTLLVVDPANTQAPTVTLTAPAAGAHVTTLTAVTGSITDTGGLLGWALEYAPASGAWKVLKQVTGGLGTAVSVSATFDPTLLANGPYVLRLSATNTGGRVGTATRAVQVDGHLKLGSFAVSFTDLTIPVAGIPITVGRRYETLDAPHNGPLGYGWSQVLGGFAAQPDPATLAPAFLNGLPTYKDGTRVYVTRPDGGVDGYTFTPVPAEVLFGIVLSWYPAFTRDPDVLNDLRADRVPLTKIESTGEYIDYELGGYNPALPSFGGAFDVVEYTGLTHEIDAATGVQVRVRDRRDNTLTFTDDGITSNRGVAVTFERDPQGRIAAVVDPRGNSVRYAYNATGDLISVTDRAGTATTYEYLNSLNGPSHYLAAIIDAQGRRSTQAQYDSAGRVIQLLDAVDHPINIGYNVSERTETVSTPGRAPATVSYDERGNPVGLQSPEGGVTTAAFEHDRPTTVTRVVGQPDGSSGEHNDLTSSATYDDSGNVRSVTKPDGTVTRMTYGPFGAVATVSDPLGNTTTYEYDSEGNQLRVRYPDGRVAQSEYDGHGDRTSHTEDGATTTMTYTAEGYLQTETSPSGVVTTYHYDANGNQTEASFTWVNPDPPHDSRLVTTAYVFDANDRAVQTITPTGTTGTDYNGLGQVIRTTDRFGLVTETTYNKRGLPIQTRSESRDRNGNVAWLVTRIVYDGNGRVSVSTAPYVEGSTEPVWGTRSSYDGDDRLKSSERLKGVVIDIVGSGPNLESQVANPGTVVWSTNTAYDELGRVTEFTNSFGQITRYAYNSTGKRVETRTQGLDENDSLVWQVTRTVFDAFGRTVLTTDPYLVSADGHETVLTADITGQRLVYDNLGQVRESQQLHNVVVGLVNGETVVRQAGAVVSRAQSVYGDKGRLLRTTDEAGAVTDYEYDVRGRLIATVASPVQIDGASIRHRIETEYDDYGNVLLTRTTVKQSADGSGIDRSNARETVYSYDQLGNPTKTTFADGTFVETRYDTFGRATTQVDQRGKETTYDYDLLNRLVGVQLPPVPDPDHGNQLTIPRWEYGYDAKGNLVRTRDPLGRETAFTYDERGNQLTRALPDGTAERTEYCQECGKPELHVSFEGVVTQYVYDERPGANHRLLALRYFPSEAAYNNGQGTPSETIGYVYDGLGRVIRLTHDHSGSQDVWATSYDANGRVIREVSPQGAVNYEYDVATGRRTRTFAGETGSYAGDQANPVNDTRYVYDTLGRLTQVTAVKRSGITLAPSQVTSYAYDLVGNVARTTTPDGIITVQTYDALDRLTHLTKYQPDATSQDLSDNPRLAAIDSLFRTDGKRQSATETFWFDADGNGTAEPHQNTFNWTYSDDGRLTDEAFSSYDPSLSQTEHFVFDLAGNRRQMTTDRGNDGVIDQTTTYQYDVNDRLLVEQADLDNNGTVDRTATYDYTGTHQTAKSVRAGGVTAGVTEQTASAYNLQGWLSQATVTTYTGGSPSRIERTSFTYAPVGDRVSTLGEMDADANGTFETRTRTDYLIDKRNATGYAQVLQGTTTNADTAALVKKVVYTIGRHVISQTTFAPGGPAAGTTLVLHADGGGSTRVLTDLAAAIAQAQGVRQIFHYDAFGNALGFAPAAALTNLLYRGEAFDSRVGLQYLRARWYDPSVGRFSQLDPLAGDPRNPLGLHRYLYASGDPVNGTDPTGLQTLTTTNVDLALRLGMVALVVGWVLQPALQYAWDVLFVISAAEPAWKDAVEWTLTAVQETLTQPDVQAVATAIATAVAANLVNCPVGAWVFPDPTNGYPWVGVAVVGRNTVYTPRPFTYEPGWFVRLNRDAPPPLPPPNDRWERGHLVGRQLGGPSNGTNLIPQSGPANERQRDDVENKIGGLAREGACLVTVVLASYGNADPWERVPTSTTHGYVSLPGPWPQVSPRVFAPTRNP